MKTKAVPILLVIMLILSHIFSFPQQPVSSLSFVHGIGALVYLCVWGMLLWYSVKVLSKRLLVLYNVFWILSIILLLLSGWAFGIGFRRSLPPMLDIITHLVMWIGEMFFAPLQGFALIPIPESILFWILIFTPLFMLGLGVIAMRKIKG